MAKDWKIAETVFRGMEKTKRLTPDNVVNDARADNHPLHAWFNWDDAHEAHERRKDQAREYIAMVTTIVRTETTVTKVPVFVHNPALEPGEQGYVTLTRLRSSKDHADAALRAELASARAALSRALAVGMELGISDVGDRLRALVKEVVGVMEMLDVA